MLKKSLQTIQTNCLIGILYLLSPRLRFWCEPTVLGPIRRCFYAQAFILLSCLYLLVLPVGPDVAIPEVKLSYINAIEITSSTILVLLAV